VQINERTHDLLIMGDLEPFKAPDGTIITGRAKLRQYFKETGTTHISDYNSPGGHWDKLKAERERAYTPGAGYDSKRRKEQLARAFDKLRR
jgi:hypothetical protein